MPEDIGLLIRKAKLKLFTKSLIFFGMCANKFAWEIENFDENIESYVLFDSKDLTKIESGTIFLNKHFLLKSDYTYNNLIFVICHELLHILNKHGIRRGDRKWKEWNVACDHVIEVFLKKLSDTIKPYNNKYNIIEELEYQKPNCTAEYAYDWIMKYPSKIKISDVQDMSITVTDGNGKFMFNVSAIIGGITPQNGATDELDESTKNMLIDQFVAESRALFENIKTQGNLPGYLTAYLDNLLKVEIPWETLVEKSIKTNIIMKPDDRSWRSLNKFFMPHKMNLPGCSLLQDLEGTGNLIIGCDSSTSISTRDLKKFSGIIEISMRHFKTVNLIVHDTIIHQRKLFDKDNIHEFYKFISNEGYRGRGGTSHKYLFEEIQTEHWEKDKDDLSMVISLTDGFSDIEAYYQNQKFEWIKNNIPLVFIITKDGKEMDLSQTYGNISQIKINN
jgi:hypothetical protein